MEGSATKMFLIHHRRVKVEICMVLVECYVELMEFHPVTSGQASFNFKDSHVKFSIKLFRVPKLYIEVPETATVGSLKRTVMEAVTAIFKDNLDTLGSTMEPSALQATPSMCADDPHPSLSGDIPQLNTRSPGTSVLDSGMPDALLEPPLPVDLLGVSIFCTSLWTAYKLGEKGRIRPELLSNPMSPSNAFLHPVVSMFTRSSL